MAITGGRASITVEQDAGLDPEEAVGLLLRDLRASPDGLSSAEAQRRALQYGPNELRRRAGLRWPVELLAQLTQPLALLLWAAAALSFAVGNRVIGIAVLLVILLNAAFAQPPGTAGAQGGVADRRGGGSDSDRGRAVWEADELRRWLLRRRNSRAAAPPRPARPNGGRSLA